MGSRIKMQGIHDIIPFRNRVGSRLIQKLAPVGSAYQNHRVLVILPDCGNDLLRILLHPAPARSSIGLITNLIDNIIPIPKFRRHFSEETLCLFLIGIRIPIRKNMPVNNYIHVLAGSIFHAVPDQLLQLSLIAACTIAPVFSGVHGKTDHIDIPLLMKLLKKGFIHIIGKPCQTVGADTLKLHRIALTVTKTRTNHL